MNKTISAALILIGLLAAAGRAQDPPRYRNYAEMTAALKGLADAHKNIARLRSIGRSGQGREVWLIEIANPAGVPVKDRPGLFIAANLEGDHLIGSEIALRTAEYFLQNYPGDPDVKQRLDSQAVYIAPRINPDGAELMFAPVQTGRRTNARPRDDENDGRTDEDGPEDLNKDGFVTVMRVKAADGDYLIDPEEPRLMKKADAKKGERGAYKLYWEGVDNDADGFIGEDPEGGTDINRNFMHDYPYYQPVAGPHMASEPETRAVLDWLIAHRNVAAILALGESDNLIVPATSAGRAGPAREIDLVRFAEASCTDANKVGLIAPRPSGFGRFGEGMFEMGEMFAFGRTQAQPTAPSRPRFPERKPATTVNAGDVDYLRAASDKYRELTGFKQPLFVREARGALFQYGYFQYGVPSFSTPGWGIPTAAEPQGFRRPTMAGETQAGSRAGAEGARDRAPAGASAAGGDQAAPDFRGGRGFEFFQEMRAGAQTVPAAETAPPPPGIDKQVLKFFDSEKIDGSVAWTRCPHPEFGEVEVGGFKPYAVVNPPAARLPEIAAAHARFAVHLGSLFPRIRIARTEVIDHGGGLFRIKAEVENAGVWPLALAQGVTARAVKPAMVRLEVKPEAIIQGNPKVNFIPSLDGSGGREKFEWLIRAGRGDRVGLRVVSQNAGSDAAALVLK